MNKAKNRLFTCSTLKNSLTSVGFPIDLYLHAQVSNWMRKIKWLDEPTRTKYRRGRHNLSSVPSQNFHSEGSVLMCNGIPVKILLKLQCVAARQFTVHWTCPYIQQFFEGFLTKVSNSDKNVVTVICPMKGSTKSFDGFPRSQNYTSVLIKLCMGLILENRKMLLKTLSAEKQMSNNVKFRTNLLHSYPNYDIFRTSFFCNIFRSDTWLSKIRLIFTDAVIRGMKNMVILLAANHA